MEVEKILREVRQNIKECFNKEVTKMQINKKEFKYVVFGDGFSVEFYYDGLLTQFWLTHKDYGIKHFMFGIPEKLTDEQIIGYIERNVKDHKGFYKDNYMDEDIPLF